jgi:hypothetical protein
VQGWKRRLVQPRSKIYFDPNSQFYGKTKAGGFTCRALADKAGFRANKGNYCAGDRASRNGQ